MRTSEMKSLGPGANSKMPAARQSRGRRGKERRVRDGTSRVDQKPRNETGKYSTLLSPNPNLFSDRHHQLPTRLLVPVPAMKSCLKSPSIPGSPMPGACYKHVAWGADGSDEVHWADEWDRTPSVPSQKLSYQELLELEEITSSLPSANQPFDLRPPKQALSRVPINLLPLGSADAPKSPPPTSPSSSQQSPQSPGSTFVMPPGRSRPAPAPRMASPSLTHLRPLAQPAQRPKPTFAFVPLLATPSPTPAPETASSFPPYTPERAAADGEPDRVILPRSKAVPIPSSHSAHAHVFGGYGYEAQYRAAEAAAYSPPFGSSAYDYKRDKHGMLADDKQQPVASGSKNPKPVQKRRKKKTSIIVINDMEIEVEEEGSETDSAADSEADELAKNVSDVVLQEDCVSPLEKLPPPIVAGSPTTTESMLSPRLATRPQSPRSPASMTNKALVAAAPNTPRPQSPTAGRLSPVQARASSRLLRT
ncbi:hypothetical protein HMN09_00409700 [Mycena chlorophos]|uniref:Uncharacterized protein n=1 Tax=Mycena chlorophos TaxID=658473 RepID=A0A8H6THF7_MYCCL|nr:hypothetical protein HMN09_00409700 [Mycena chlorophos]